MIFIERNEKMSKNKDIVKALYIEYEPYIRKICLYKLRSIPDKIDDCVQETFEALIEAMDKSKQIKNPKAWLTVVANNIIKDTYTEINKEKERIVEFSSENIDKLSSANTIDNSIFTVSDEQIDLYKEQIINRLDFNEQRLLYDRYTLKKSITQIADEQNTTENNIYQKLFRLKQKIKMIIKKVLPDDIQ